MTIIKIMRIMKIKDKDINKKDKVLLNMFEEVPITIEEIDNIIMIDIMILEIIGIMIEVDMVKKEIIMKKIIIIKEEVVTEVVIEVTEVVIEVIEVALEVREVEGLDVAIDQILLKFF